MKDNIKNVKTVLFVSLSNLGDIILTTPVLEKVHFEFPGSVIDVITGAPGREIFERHPAVRRVETPGVRRTFASRIKQMAGLRRESYDLVVDLRNSLMPYLVNARFHTGISLTAEDPDMHKRDEHLMKLASLGIDPLADIRFFMPVSDREREYIDRLIDPEWKRIVVISPGAKSHLKRWSAVKFAKLADKIVSELKCRVILIGNEEDNETMGHIMSAVTTPVKDLCCKTTIGALAELMKRSDLVITNDSAPLHVASAVDAPTLAIFGPTDEKKYGPLAGRSRVIKPEKPCRPCGRALCAVGPVEGCIADITVEEVFEEARKMLG